MAGMLREMKTGDIAAVLSIQAECYADAMVESESVIIERLRSASGFAWVAQQDDALCAYLFAYPSVPGKVTRLGENFAVPANPSCLYLHDLAVSPRAAGRRLGPKLVGLACEQARHHGLRSSALVSVQDSRAFWEKLGYAVDDRLIPPERANLQTYTGPAWYMTRCL